MTRGRWESSARLTARARRVIPGALFGHRRSFAFAAGTQREIPDAYPHFVDRAAGCRFWDVDGNEYVDYLCGYGPMIVGYGNEEVESAAAAERTRGDCLTFPSALSVDLAERLVIGEAWLAGANGWAAFALNGSDAVIMAVVVARAATGRDILVMADGAFHGTQAWARSGLGWSTGDLDRTRTVPWGDAVALEAALTAGPVAAVVLCPYEQLVGAENHLPAPGWWDTVRRLCTAFGAVLVIDDVRSGFRVDRAGTCAHFGIRPDLVCLSKAMANGYPIAALVGIDALRDAAREVFVSGTFWGHGPGLAAAGATIDVLGHPGVHEHLAAMGRRLTDGLTSVAADRGLQLAVSGPPALPHVGFDGDEDYALACAFAEALAAEGSLVHPTHNWFLSTAHTAVEVDRTLEHATMALDVALR